MDSAGNLYIAETAAHRVRKVSPSGTITTVAGTGAQRCSGPSDCLPLGDGGPAISAALSFPTSVAVDSAGNLFIADSANLRVRKVSPDGIITTVAGNGSAPAWPREATDGEPATGVPIIPSHVAVDGAGNLYIAESPYAEVRKVSPDGTIHTALASPTGLPYYGFISASTVDRAGNLFVAGSVCDGEENCSLSIRKVSPDRQSSRRLPPGIHSAFSPAVMSATVGPPARRNWDSSPTLPLTSRVTFSSATSSASAFARSISTGSLPPWEETESQATPGTVGRPRMRPWITLSRLRSTARAAFTFPTSTRSVRLMRPVAQ